MDEVFSQLPGRLLPWFETHKRDLPWRRDREPYHVWLSEIMLQQTRVEAVRGYYTRFLEALPTIQALAEAPAEQLNKLWEGLGYYSRVRNLQTAARQIMTQHQGRFPTAYADIRALAGIGDYTAGAIGSICFELPTPAVDGNVLRVSARATADFTPIGRPRIKRDLCIRLAEIYPAGHCGDFTQALMELGATVCGPNGVPQCGVCPLADLCLAHAQGVETLLPVKDSKKPRRVEEMTVFLLQCRGQWALRKRPDRGLLAGLWEFPHVPGTLELAEALAQLDAWGIHPTEVERAADKVHIFTHIQWNMRGWYFQCANTPPEFQWADAAQLNGQLALPTAFRIFYDAATS